MAIKYSFLVKPSEIEALKAVVRLSNAYYPKNPEKCGNVIYVTLAFTSVKDYNNFHQEWNRLTRPVVETDNRKWYTRYINRIKLLFRK